MEIDEDKVEKDRRVAVRRMGNPSRRKPCWTCGLPLGSDVEEMIGVHVTCVHEQNKRSIRFTIPRPRYGSKRP